jgi:hypothetical protein
LYDGHLVRRETADNVATSQRPRHHQVEWIREIAARGLSQNQSYRSRFTFSKNISELKKDFDPGPTLSVAASQRNLLGCFAIL